MTAAIYQNLHFILLACWRRRYLLAWPLLLMPLFAIVIAVLTPKNYVSHTTMLIQETSRLNPFMADFAVSTQLEERISALRALLHSRHILQKVATDTGQVDPADTLQTSRVLGALSEALQVQLIGTDMIKISYSSSNPSNMAQVLSAVSEHFLAALLAPEQSSMQGSENFLEKQIQAQQMELNKAEQALADFKVKYSSTLPDQYNFDVQQLRASETLLQTKRNDLAGASAALETFNGQLLKTDPVLASVEQEMVASQAKLSQLQSKYTDQHSQVVAELQNLSRLKSKREALLAQSRELKSTDLETLWQLASGMQQSAEGEGQRTLLVSQLEATQNAKSRYSQLEQETKQLQQVVDGLRTKLEAFGTIEMQLSALERDISTKQQIYHDLLKRYEKARVTMALGRFEAHDRVKVIDPPFTPYSAVNLPLSAYVLVGLLSGLVLGGCLVLLVETVDSSITRREVVTQICSAPVLSRIPDLSTVLVQSPLTAQHLDYEREAK
jgi:polysaccharide chain length determinant protein (PEP-CTERM system associated)